MKAIATGIVYVGTKGAIMGATVIAVVHSGLSSFAQALIIAVVSALIGSFGLIVAALITVIMTSKLERSQHETRKSVEEVKQAIGADRRSSDNPS